MIDLDNLSAHNRASFYRQVEFHKTNEAARELIGSLKKQIHQHDEEKLCTRVAERFLYSFGYSIFDKDYKEKLSKIIYEESERV